MVTGGVLGAGRPQADGRATGEIAEKQTPLKSACFSVISPVARTTLRVWFGQPASPRVSAPPR
jgi:hypothetical protein